MRVKLWAPGTALSKNLSGINLLNAMCDLMQFFVSYIPTETHVEHLAELFMENVVLLFVMFAIFDVDTNSWFKSIFKDMCAALGIIYSPIARGDHKSMRVENYHLFFNKM